MAISRFKNTIPIPSNHEMEELSLGMCIALNVNPLLWGDPGAGKSSVMKAIAETYNMHLVLHLISTMAAEDVGGTPYVLPGEESSRHAMPMYVKEVLDAHANKQTSMVFWDEFSTGKPDVQAASLTTILDRKAGPFQLPLSTRMVAAANPPKVAANGWDLPAPTANRFTHINWKLSAKDIADGFQHGWKAPLLPILPSASSGVIQSSIKKSLILVGAFLRKNPHAAEYDFSSFRGNVSGDEFKPSDNAYPTARSWNSAATLYAGCQIGKLKDGKPIPPQVTQMLLEGTVGHAVASEFLQYASTLDLPDPIAALNDPDGFELPKRNDLVSALMASVQAEALSNRSHPNYIAIWTNWGNVVARLVDDGRGDIILPFAQTWQKSMPEGAGFTKRHTQSLSGLMSAFGP